MSPVSRDTTPRTQHATCERASSSRAERAKSLATAATIQRRTRAAVGGLDAARMHTLLRSPRLWLRGEEKLRQIAQHETAASTNGSRSNSSKHRQGLARHCQPLRRCLATSLPGQNCCCAWRPLGVAPLPSSRRATDPAAAGAIYSPRAGPQFVLAAAPARPPMWQHPPLPPLPCHRGRCPSRPAAPPAMVAGCLLEAVTWRDWGSAVTHSPA